MALKQEYYDDVGEIRVAQGKYYRPIAKNYQSIDGYIHPNILFQTAISDKHGVKQEGLKKLDVLDETKKIRLYFVVPGINLKHTKNRIIKKANVVIGWIDKIEK